MDHQAVNYSYVATIEHNHSESYDCAVGEEQKICVLSLVSLIVEDSHFSRRTRPIYPPQKLGLSTLKVIWA